MICAILDASDTDLQREWLARLRLQLVRQGHDPRVYTALHSLHHVSLLCMMQTLVSGGIGDRLVAVIEQDCWMWGGWERPIIDAFERYPNLGCVAAQHGWRDFDRDSDDVVRPPDRGVHMPLVDNAAAWFCVLHGGRILNTGHHLGELEWSADGFDVYRGERGWQARGGDTGCRIVSQLREWGLDSILIPTTTENRTFAGHVAWASSCNPDGSDDWNHQWICYHHFYGRQMGKAGVVSVGHHLLLADDVTAEARKFMELNMEGVG